MVYYYIRGFCPSSILLVYDRLSIDSDTFTHYRKICSKDFITGIKTYFNEGKFSLYIPHDDCCHGVSYIALKSRFCHRIIYIEEGNLSYINTKYKYSERKRYSFFIKIPFIKNFLRTKKFFNGNYCVKFFKNAFPFINNDNTVLLDLACAINNYSYVCKTTDCDHVILINPKDNIENLAIILNQIKNINNRTKVYIKLHPIYNLAHYKSKRNAFIDYMSSNNLCSLSDDIIIEIESYYSDLTLHGSKSSLIRYILNENTNYNII